MAVTAEFEQRSTMSRVEVPVSEDTWMDFRAVAALVPAEQLRDPWEACDHAQRMLAYLEGLPYFRLNALMRAAAARKLA